MSVASNGSTSRRSLGGLRFQCSINILRISGISPKYRQFRVVISRKGKMATTEFEGNAGEAEPKNACLNHECTFYFKKDGNTLEVMFRFCLRVCRGLSQNDTKHNTHRELLAFVCRRKYTAYTWNASRRMERACVSEGSPTPSSTSPNSPRPT